MKRNYSICIEPFNGVKLRKINQEYTLVHNEGPLYVHVCGLLRQLHFFYNYKSLKSTGQYITRNTCTYLDCYDNYNKCVYNYKSVKRTHIDDLFYYVDCYSNYNFYVFMVLYIYAHSVTVPYSSTLHVPAGMSTGVLEGGLGESGLKLAFSHSWSYH